MDYSYVKFGDCTFSRFGSIVQTDTHRCTHSDRRRIADERIKPHLHQGNMWPGNKQHVEGNMIRQYHVTIRQ